MRQGHGASTGFTPMSKVNFQSQISKLQSQLDKKSASRGRSRSRTPVRNEKGKGSNKRNAKKNKSRSRSRSASQKRVATLHDNLSVWDKYPGLKAIVLKKQQADKRLKEALNAPLKTVDQKDCVHRCMNPQPTRFQVCDGCGKPLGIDYAKKSWKILQSYTPSDSKIDESIWFKEANENAKKMLGDVQPDLKEMYDIVCKEFDLARNAMRAGLGDKPIKIRMTAPFVITTTVTSGVTNTIVINGNGTGVAANDATEFSSLAALFDEVKVYAGAVDFLYKNAVATAAAGASMVLNNMPTMAFDPADSTAATSSESLMQLSQHESFSPLMGATSPVMCPANGMKHHFKFHVPPGVSIGTNNAPAGSQWQPATGPVAVGYLKFYHVGNEITAINTGVGVLYYYSEWRCRT